jgi:hypothetical protein
VTELTLSIDCRNLPNVFDLFQKSVDLSHLVKLSLPVQCYPRSIQNTVANIITLLKRTCNIRSLAIYYRRSRICPMEDVHNIYAILPRYIEHLTIEILSVDDMKVIFDRLEYLTSITFVWSIFAKSYTANIEWLRNNVNDFTHIEDGNRIYVWLGKYIKKRTEIKVGSKRVKLSHNP